MIYILYMKGSYVRYLNYVLGEENMEGKDMQSFTRGLIVTVVIILGIFGLISLIKIWF